MDQEVHCFLDENLPNFDDFIGDATSNVPKHDSTFCPSFFDNELADHSLSHQGIKGQVGVRPRVLDNLQDPSMFCYSSMDKGKGVAAQDQQLLFYPCISKQDINQASTSHWGGDASTLPQFGPNQSDHGSRNLDVQSDQYTSSGWSSSVFPGSTYAVNGSSSGCIDGNVAENLMTSRTYMSLTEGISFDDVISFPLSANPLHWSHRVTGVVAADKDKFPSRGKFSKKEATTADEPGIKKKRGPGRPKGSFLKNKASQPTAMSSSTIELTPLSIRIGRWERISKTGWDLLVKCYFGKRQLVWDFLCCETYRKSRIWLDWEIILMVDTFLSPEGYETLRVELSQAPKFGKERELKNGVHSVFDPCEDFTSGEAITSRVHELVFRPGNLFDEFKKILERSLELRMLSEKSSSSFDGANTSTTHPSTPVPPQNMFPMQRHYQDMAQTQAQPQCCDGRLRVYQDGDYTRMLEHQQ